MGIYDKKIQEQVNLILESSPELKGTIDFELPIESYYKHNKEVEKTRIDLEKKKSQDVEKFDKLEKEACRLIFDIPTLKEWFYSFIVPLSIIPQDPEDTFEIDPKLRMKQIKANAIKEVVERILIKGEQYGRQ